MSIITTLPTIGQRVTANRVPGLPQYDGKTAIVTEISGTIIRGEFQSVSKPDDTENLAFTDWSPAFPAIGDKLRAVCIPHVTHDGSNSTQPALNNWNIESLEFEVVAVRENDAPPRVYGNFTANRRNSDRKVNERWYVTEWEPIAAANEEPITFDTKERMIGKMIRVRYSGSPDVTIGSVHKVTSVFRHPERNNEPKIDGITVGVTITGRGDYWVQAYEIVEEPEEPEYKPTVGEYVRITGWLTDTGIITGDTFGTITAVTGDIWEARGVLGGRYISGPGYVFPAERPAAVPTDPQPFLETDVVEEPMVPKRELDRANERVAEYAKRATDWEHDFNHYANEVMQEAIERDWCEEYERVMGRVEGGLLIGSIPERRKPRVQVYRRVRGTVYTDVQVWVDEDNQYTTDTDEMYADQDDEDCVGDEWASDVINDEIMNNGLDDIEVETR